MELYQFLDFMPASALNLPDPLVIDMLAPFLEKVHE